MRRTNIIQLLLAGFTLLTLSSNAQSDSLHYYRPMQVSFFPFIGTNGPETDKYSNDFSLNIIAGYVKEVKKFEVGSVLNLVKENMNGCQIAGTGNLVGGDVNGVQIAGTFNMAKKVEGVQISGCMNYALQTSGLQIAGLINGTKNGTPLQLAAGANFAEKGAIFQLAAGANFSPKSVNCQISAATNAALDSSRVQITAGVNLAKQVEGVQVSAGVNVAQKVKGVQIGIVNITDSIDGVQVGLINLSRNGYRRFELGTDEISHIGIAYRSGTNPFHTILSTGVNINKDKVLPICGFGVGFYRPITSDFGFEMETHFNSIFDFNDNGYNLLSKAYMGIEQKMSSKIALSFGVTYNVMQIFEQNGKTLDVALPYTITDNSYDDFRMQSWVGARFGIRIL